VRKYANRIVTVVLGFWAAAISWLLIASFLFSISTKTEFRPLLWFDAVRWWWPGTDLQLWLLNWWAALWIMIAAIWASAATGVAIVAVFWSRRFKRRKATRQLYGTTEWASRAERERGGLRRKKIL
jgi:hypothetical protein